MERIEVENMIGEVKKRKEKGRREGRRCEGGVEEKMTYSWTGDIKWIG